MLSSGRFSYSAVGDAHDEAGAGEGHKSGGVGWERVAEVWRRLRSWQLGEQAVKYS